MGCDSSECKKDPVGGRVREAKEILMGDEFSVTILMYRVAF